MTTPNINADVREMISFNLPQQHKRLVADRDSLLKKLADIQREIADVELHVLLEKAFTAATEQEPRELVRSDETGLQVPDVGESVGSGE